jgi:hypothetical protein
MVIAEIGKYSIDLYCEGRIIANLAKDRAKFRDNPNGSITITLFHPHNDEPSFLFVDMIQDGRRKELEEDMYLEIEEEKTQKAELEERKDG